MMSFKDEKNLVRLINKLLASKECLSEFQLDNLNREVDFSKPAHLIKAIEIFRKANEFESSLECSRYLVKLHGEFPASYQRLIQDYLTLDFVGEALKTAIEAHNKFSEDPGILMLASNACRANGKLKDALKYSSYLLEKHPSLPAGYYCVAKIMVDLGRLREAKKTIRNLTDLIKLPLSMELARDFYRSIGLRQRARRISSEIANSFPSLENYRQAAIDILVIGNLQRFYRYTKKHKLIINETDKKYFDNILSTNFAMNLSKPLTPSWRTLSGKHKIFDHYNDPRFNKYPNEISKDDQQIPWLCVVHVGKCAGETVIKTLRRSLPTLSQRIIEYHIFDSNLLINQLLELSKKMPNIEIIFCTRDPLERWISSFNWDYYLYKFNRHYYCPSDILNLFDFYPNSKMLARGLYNGEKEAIMLSKSKHFIFGHMAMGQSWYLPKRLIHKINLHQGYVVRTESIEYDLKFCIHRLVNKYPEILRMPRNINVLKFKNSQKFRADFTFTLSCDLTQIEREAVLHYVSEDSEVNKLMSSQFLFGHE